MNSEKSIRRNLRKQLGSRTARRSGTKTNHVANKRQKVSVSLNELYRKHLEGEV